MGRAALPEAEPGATAGCRGVKRARHGPGNFPEVCPRQSQTRLAALETCFRDYENWSSMRRRAKRPLLQQTLIEDCSSHPSEHACPLGSTPGLSQSFPEASPEIAVPARSKPDQICGRILVFDNMLDQRVEKELLAREHGR